MKQTPKKRAPGAGRPPIDPSRVKVQMSIRFSPEQRDKILTYGRDWLRELVDNGKPPKQ